MIGKRLVLLVLVLSSALVVSGCTKTLAVSDLQLEEDLTAVVETETGQAVADVTCPEEIEDPEDGTTFTCDLELDDGSTVTANIELEEEENGNFTATYQGLEE